MLVRRDGRAHEGGSCSEFHPTESPALTQSINIKPRRQIGDGRQGTQEDGPEGIAEGEKRIDRERQDKDGYMYSIHVLQYVCVYPALLITMCVYPALSYRLF